MGQDVDGEEFWRRVGLDELRHALARVHGLTARFEEVVRTLPPCNACARAHLLEQIDTVCRHLGSEATVLAVLAATLTQAVAAAEQTRAELVAKAPDPCQCPSGPCTCHE